MDIDSNILRAADILNEADAVVISAGAGIGVDSGLPDFRGDEGFWKAYPPIAKLGISFVEMANPYWFERKPALAWAFYGHRLNLYRETIPHKGFTQLLKLGSNKPGEYFVFTSNVDGQFQKAGYDNDRIEEFHGSIHHFQCSIPCSDSIWDAEDENVEVDEEVFEALDPLPKCKNCGNLARPNILMFGDWNWLSDRSNIQAHQANKWLNTNIEKRNRIAIIEIGAGKAVPTVRHKSESIALHSNETLIRINPRDFEVPSGHISIPLNSAVGINRIIEKM